MNKALILFCSCALILLGLSCSDDPPEGNPQVPPSTKKLNTTPTAQSSNIPVLAAGQMIKVGDNPMSIGHTASPEIVDWNNDGKKDLILGTYITFPNPEEGKVMLYLNEGTDEAPVFKKGEFMSAAGEVISVGAG